MTEETVQNFAQLAEGATELQLHIKHGDIVANSGEGAGWSLNWAGEENFGIEIAREVLSAMGMRHRHHYRERSEGPEIVREGDVLRIRQGRNGDEIAVAITVPPTVQTVELRTGNGDVAAAGLRGRITLHSGNGDMQLEGAGGEANITTGHGDVSVEGFDGELRVSSGHGDIQLESWRGRAALKTGNGDVAVEGREGQVEVRSGHGDVTVQAEGTLEVDVVTGAGDVSVEGRTVRELRLRTGKGDSTCEAVLAPGRHEVQTGFGDVSVTLPADAPARVDAQSGFGEVHSDFPLVRVGRSGPMGFGGVRMVGSIGEGDPQIELLLRTGKGDLSIHRGAPMGSTAPSQPTSADWQRPVRRPFIGEQPVPPVPPTPPTPVVPPTPPTPVHPPAPPPGPLDLGGAVRSSQNPLPPEGEEPDATLMILEAVARGEITPEEAERRLAQRGAV